MAGFTGQSFNFEGLAMRILLILSILVPLGLSGQDIHPPDIDWSTLVGGSEQEEVNDIVELPNGYIVAVGYTTSKSIKLDEQYFFILDADGKKVRERNYGSIYNDRALGVYATYDGSFIYCGYVHSPSSGPYPTYHPTPNLRKISFKGDVLWSRVEKQIHGLYRDLIELSPGRYIVIGEEEGKAILVAYAGDSLSWKKTISNQSVNLQAISPLSDSTYLVTGLSVTDKLLWYALYDDQGNQIWAKKGPKNYGTGLSISMENLNTYWIGGSYYDVHKREDAFLVKINIKDGALLTKLNIGERYDDVLAAIQWVPNGNIYLAGKTYSHIRAGARRSKAWMLEVDPKTNKIVGEANIWGGKQNNAVTSIQRSPTGQLILGAWTASGEAERKDGWVMKINTSKSEPSLMTAGIELVHLDVIDDNQDGKIGYLESSAFRIEYKPSPKRILSIPKLITYIDGNKVGFDALMGPSSDHNTLNIPYYRETDLKGLHQVKLVLIDGATNRLDSIEKSVEFLGPDRANLDIVFDPPRLRDKLDKGQAVIDLPFSFINTGGKELVNLNTGIRGLEDIPVDYKDSLITLRVNENKKSLLSIRLQEIIAADTLLVQVYANDQASIFSASYKLPVRALLAPWIKARKDQTTVLLAEKIQTGNLTPLGKSDYGRLPLDSFFMRQNTWQIEKGKLTAIPKYFNPEKLITIWIDPDPIVTNNYFTSKRNTYPVLLKLVNQDQNADGLEARILIERPRQSGTDTVHLALDQGVLLGSYQYNLQSDIALKEGENKIRLSLWYRDELIKTSSLMVIKYEPPKSNLFVYSYGIPDPTLVHVTKDAHDLAEAFNTQQGKLFSSIQRQVYNVTSNTNTQAIKKSIRDIVNDYYEFKRIRKDDILLIYFSSHGSLIKEEFYLHPSDYDPLYEEETTINLVRDIQNKLKDIPCKKLLFIDACHSGAAAAASTVADGQKGSVFDQDLADALVRLSEASNDFYFLLSSSAGEVSYTDESWGNSAFTKGILEAFANKMERTLQGSQQADTDRNKIIDLQELYLYLRERVPVIIQSKKNLTSSQTPYTPDPKSLKDLPIYVLDKP